jgi:hypothetical protein
MNDLKDGYQRVGQKIVDASRNYAPQKSGRLRASIRTSRRQSGIVISAGGARAPYAPYVYFGSAHNRPAKPFIMQGAERVDVPAEVERAVAEVLRGLGY